MNDLSSKSVSVFFKEIEKLKQSFSFENEEEEKNFHKKNVLLFVYVSANLSRLMPQIPLSKHKSIFKKLLFNLQLLDVEEQNPTFFAPHFEIIDKQNSIQKAQNGQPSLFCCFHLGSYSLLPTLLTYEELNFGFLLNKTLMTRKAERFSAAHKMLCKEIEVQKSQVANSTMQLINVEENKGIWQAIRMLKEGKSLIVYADGNTGSNYSKTESKNTVGIDFLGEKLRVRQGIAFLSYVCNVPIVPVITSRSYAENELSLKRKFEFLPAIFPPSKTEINSKKKISKDKFAAQTMQTLYSILEKQVIKSATDTRKVSEWEGWIFVNMAFENLHNSKLNATRIQITKSNKNLAYVFNQDRFVLIETQTKKNDKENTKNTLFDRFTYRFFPVSELLYEIIIYFSVPKKLYLSDNEQETKKQANQNQEGNNYPILTNPDERFTDSNPKLQLSKTIISVSSLEKLIEKEILVHSNLTIE